LFKEDGQQQLAEIKRDTGFKSIRMHCPLTDDIGAGQAAWLEKSQLWVMVVGLHATAYYECIECISVR
jgi:hypothetical protein